MCNTMLACSFPCKDGVVNGSQYGVAVAHLAKAWVMGGVSCFSRLATLRRWQRGVQQLFQCSGACRGDTGDRRKLGGVSAEQLVQAAKARTDSACGDGADAWQGQHDLHLPLRQG